MSYLTDIILHIYDLNKNPILLANSVKESLVCQSIHIVQS